MPNGRCRLHGGATPAGPASPHWKTGRHSGYARFLSADRQDDYHAALSAPDPLSLVEEMSLARALLTEALSPGPDLYALRRVLHAAENTLEKALREEETADARYVQEGVASGEEWSEARASDWDEDIAPAEVRVRDEVEKALKLVHEGYEILTGQEVRPTDHEKVQKYIGALKGLVDTSARVMDIRANSFTRIQSMALVARLVEMIADNVRDPQDRKRLITSLAQIGDEVAPARQIAERKGGV